MKNTKRNNEYLKNTIVLMLGKVATQFMSFLLIPLYTHFLDTSDYGNVDLIQTYISLLVPLLILRFDSAVFRFLIDERNSKNEDNKKKIITNVFITLSVISIIFTLIYITFTIFVELKYILLIYFNIIVIMFSNILLQISRGIGKNKDYSVACVVTGTTTLIINIILIVLLGFDAGSILIASTIGNLLCCLYLIARIKIFRFIDLKFFDKTQLKTMLKYSVPMIPNALSWWIVNVSDRTIISVVWGTALNGIYTVSCKFSSIVYSIFSIFNMSWQESASLHIDDEDRNEFFSKMINEILMLFFSVTTLLIAILPLVYNIVIGESYIESYIYIPILLVANLFHILIQLFGGIYIAKKKTKEIMNTTLISAIINIVVNLLFIKKFGLFAASFSTLIAYLSMAIYRYIDIQKYVKFKFEMTKFVIQIVALIITIIAYYYKSFIVCIFIFFVTCASAIYINRDIIVIFLKGIKKRIGI